VPAAPEDYVHRIGRTGRAGNKGQAITIVTPVDELSLRGIERLMGQAVKRVVLPGFGGNKTVAPSLRAQGGPTRSVFTRSFRPRRASR
jgi:ATP-dependent RNA helicase RhlE